MQYSGIIKHGTFFQFKSAASLNEIILNIRYIETENICLWKQWTENQKNMFKVTWMFNTSLQYNEVDTCQNSHYNSEMIQPSLLGDWIAELTQTVGW